MKETSRGGKDDLPSPDGDQGEGGTGRTECGSAATRQALESAGGFKPESEVAEPAPSIKKQKVLVSFGDED
jgi:hypothetical protein